jgi:hypothetical protein
MEAKMATVDTTGARPSPDKDQRLIGELLPPEGDLQVGYRIFQLLEKVVAFKNELGLSAKWNRHYELAKNKHWKNDSKKVTLITANLLFAHRSRTVNTLTDNNPTFNIQHVGETDEQKEEILLNLLRTSEFWWGDQEQQGVLEASIQNGETYGCTIEKVIFNEELEYGIGEVETVLVPGYHFGMYPVKCMDVQKAEGAFHFWPMSVREAKRRWPEVAEHITSDKQLLDDLGDERIEVSANMRGRLKGYFSTISGVVKNMLNVAGEGDSEDDELLVVEAWVKDYTRETDGKKTWDKYPGNIRCVTTLNGGKIVCSDRKNPSINPNLDIKQASKTYLFDKFPFSFTQSVTDTANPWGMCDYEQLEGLQIELNKSLSQLTLIKDRLSRLKIKNPQDSGVDNSEFTNAPGIINPANSMVSEAIKYMDLPNVPFADLSAALSIYKDFFYLVAGTFELEQAQTPGREVIAYKAIATLLERAATMMRGKIRSYSKMIRVRGRMYLSHVMNWYTVERWISYEVEGEEMTSAIKGTEMIIPSKLNVISGSTLPRSKIQEREEAMQLYESQAIDNQELLKRLEWPQWREVIKRMQLGPLGDLLEKLEKIGVPQPLIEAMTEFQQIDMKDFDFMLERGQIPTIQELLAPPDAEEQIPPTDQAEVEKTMAEVQKIFAEIALTQEQIKTEQVEQAVKLAGVEFDQEKIEIEKAKLVQDGKLKEKEIESGVEIAKAKDGNGDATKTATKREQGPHIEKGLQSDNE